MNEGTKQIIHMSLQLIKSGRTSQESRQEAVKYIEDMLENGSHEERTYILEAFQVVFHETC